MCIPNDLLNKKTNPYLVESVTKYLTFYCKWGWGYRKGWLQKGQEINIESQLLALKFHAVETLWYLALRYIFVTNPALSLLTQIAKFSSVLVTAPFLQWWRKIFLDYIQISPKSHEVCIFFLLCLYLIYRTFLQSWALRKVKLKTGEINLFLKP